MPTKRLALLFVILCIQCAFMGITGLLPAVAFGWLAVGTALRPFDYAQDAQAQDTARKKTLDL